MNDLLMPRKFGRFVNVDTTIQCLPQNVVGLAHKTLQYIYYAQMGSFELGFGLLLLLIYLLSTTCYAL